MGTRAQSVRKHARRSIDVLDLARTPRDADGTNVCPIAESDALIIEAEFTEVASDPIRGTFAK
jgi:hypothetical protein